MKEAVQSSGNGASNQMAFLTRLVVLAVAACLIISVCMNVYIGVENAFVKRENQQVKYMLQQSDAVVQVAQYIVNDLKILSASDKNALGILQKYRAPIAELGLGAQDRGLQRGE